LRARFHFFTLLQVAHMLLVLGRSLMTPSLRDMVERVDGAAVHSTLASPP